MRRVDRLPVDIGNTRNRFKDDPLIGTYSLEEAGWLWECQLDKLTNLFTSAVIDHTEIQSTGHPFPAYEGGTCRAHLYAFLLKESDRRMRLYPYGLDMRACHPAKNLTG